MPTATAASQLASFIAKFDPRVASLIRSTRAAMRKRLPTANELVYDNYNFFVIGYSPSERPSECIASLAADSKGVVLSFYHGASLPDPTGVLLGEGKQNRYVRLPSAATLAEPAVEELVRAAIAHSRTPFASTGRGQLIIRAISPKQRPRRK